MDKLQTQIHDVESDLGKWLKGKLVQETITYKHFMAEIFKSLSHGSHIYSVPQGKVIAEQTIKDLHISHLHGLRHDYLSVQDGQTSSETKQDINEFRRLTHLIKSSVQRYLGNEVIWEDDLELFVNDNFYKKDIPKTNKADQVLIDQVINTLKGELNVQVPILDLNRLNISDLMGFPQYIPQVNPQIFSANSREIMPSDSYFYEYGEFPIILNGIHFTVGIYPETQEDLDNDIQEIISSYQE